MKQPIYLVVGTPGSGKTWVCQQLGDKFDYLPHDDFGDPKRYIEAIVRLATYNQSAAQFNTPDVTPANPVLIETPFSVTQIKEPLEARGYKVIPVFIIETPEVTTKRYEDRDQKPIPKGHLTRIETYKTRAKELGAFSGTAEQVLAHLRTVSK